MANGRRPARSLETLAYVGAGLASLAAILTFFAGGSQLVELVVPGLATLALIVLILVLVRLQKSGRISSRVLWTVLGGAMTVVIIAAIVMPA